MATEEKTKAVTDLFEQAMKSYEQALKTGLKLQEESTRMWTGLFSQAGTPPDWQKKSKALSEDAVAQTQKNLEECLKLIEQNSRASVELLKKAVAASQATSVQDGQTKLIGLWESSLNTLRDSALSVSQANARAVEAWMGLARKGWDTLSARA